MEVHYRNWKYTTINFRLFIIWAHGQLSCPSKACIPYITIHNEWHCNRIWISRPAVSSVLILLSYFISCVVILQLLLQYVKSLCVHSDIEAVVIMLEAGWVIEFAITFCNCRKKSLFKQALVEIIHRKSANTN